MPDILRAILLMVLGSFLFMLADLFMKLSTQTMSIGLVTMMLGAGMGLFFLVLMQRAGTLVFDRRYLHFAMAMRCTPMRRAPLTLRCERTMPTASPSRSAWPAAPTDRRILFSVPEPQDMAAAHDHSELLRARWRYMLW